MYDKHKIILFQMICSQSWSDIEDSGFHNNIDGREILDDSTSVSAPANINHKVTLNTTKHIIHRDIKQLIYNDGSLDTYTYESSHEFNKGHWMVMGNKCIVAIVQNLRNFCLYNICTCIWYACS